MGVLGGQWTLLIARDIISGINKFDKIQKNLQISRNLLTQRLKEMEKEGLLQKKVPEGLKRAVYIPTKKCFDLTNVFIAFIEWSEKWGYLPKKSKVKIRSKETGEELTLALTSKEEANDAHEPIIEISSQVNPAINWNLMRQE